MTKVKNMKDKILNEIKELDAQLSSSRGSKRTVQVNSGFTAVTYYNMVGGKGRLPNLVKLRDCMREEIKRLEVSCK